MSLKTNRLVRRFLRVLLFLFILANVVAYFHAYRFTHFSGSAVQRSKNENLDIMDKAKILFLGVENPRPVNKNKPSSAFETVRISSNKEIECWYMEAKEPRGAVALFHGYGGEKSGMLGHAEYFLSLGFNTLLVDFMGAGGSEGNQTTIGYKEAIQVKDCYEFLKTKNQKNIFLFGSSMGAAAILKAAEDYSIQTNGFILECPFGSLYKTVGKRFENMGVPKFPMAGLLVFWGGAQNGFWGFGHNPESYAKSVRTPTLLLFGEQDDRVTREEIDHIYQNISVDKRLVLFPDAGHENYFLKYKAEWELAINDFLLKNTPNQQNVTMN